VLPPGGMCCCWPSLSTWEMLSAEGVTAILYFSLWIERLVRKLKSNEDKI
jgi:hypothetical protein